MKTDRQLYLDAIFGCGCPRGGKYTTFTGNQWNEDWEWNKKEVQKMSTAKLKRFYAALKIGKDFGAKPVYISAGDFLTPEKFVKMMDEALWKVLNNGKSEE